MAVKGLLWVLGLQACLLYLSHGAESKCDAELQRAELDTKSMTTAAIHQAEAPPLGLQQNYREPDIMLVKRSLGQHRHAEKKKKRKSKAGAFSALSSARGKRNEGSNIKALKLHNSRPHQGHMSPIGETGVSEVLRARRQIDKGKARPKKPIRPGTWSALNYHSTKDMERPVKKDEKMKENLDD